MSYSWQDFEVGCFILHDLGVSIALSELQEHFAEH